MKGFRVFVKVKRIIMDLKNIDLKNLNMEDIKAKVGFYLLIKKL